MLRSVQFADVRYLVHVLPQLGDPSLARQQAAQSRRDDSKTTFGPIHNGRPSKVGAAVGTSSSGSAFASTFASASSSTFASNPSSTFPASTSAFASVNASVVAAPVVPSVEKLSRPPSVAPGTPARKVVLPLIPKAGLVATPKAKDPVETPTSKKVAIPLVKTPVVGSAAPVAAPVRSLSRAQGNDTAQESDPFTDVREAGPSEKGKTPLRGGDLTASARPESTDELEDSIEVKKIRGRDITAKVADKPLLTKSTKKPHAGTLRISMPLGISEQDASVGASSSPATVKMAWKTPGSAVNSRPATPVAAIMANPLANPVALSATEAPIKRTVQPRTLRITDTPKKETPPAIAPSPTATASESKVGSRRPSVTSTAQPSQPTQPGTPVSERIDLTSLASASRTASRAASRTGSRANSPAPIQGKRRADKSKAKKEARKKNEEELAAQLILEEQQSPIMGRKKKSKKPGLAPSATVSRATSNAISRPQSVEMKPIIPPEEPVKVSETPEVQTPVQEYTPLVEEPVVQSPKPRKPENVLSSMIDNLDALLETAFMKTVSYNGHIKNLAEHRAFSSPADLKNYDIHIHGGLEETHIPHDLPKSASYTPEQQAAYIRASRAIGNPIRLVGRDDRISSHYVETPRLTRVFGLTPEEQDRLLDLEDSICNGTRGSTFWGAGNPTYLPNVPGVRERNAETANQIDTIPQRVILAFPGSDFMVRDPLQLFDRPIFEKFNAADLRVKSDSPDEMVSEEVERPNVIRPNVNYASFDDDPMDFTPTLQAPVLFPRIYPDEDDENGRIRGPIAPGEPDSPQSQIHTAVASTNSITDPALSSVFDKLDRAAGGARKAAVAIGGTQEILRRAIGDDDGLAPQVSSVRMPGRMNNVGQTQREFRQIEREREDREVERWKREAERERRAGVEVERRLNALVRRNRKVLVAGATKVPV